MVFNKDRFIENGTNAMWGNHPDLLVKYDTMFFSRQTVIFLSMRWGESERVMKAVVCVGIKFNPQTPLIPSIYPYLSLSIYTYTSTNKHTHAVGMQWCGKRMRER